MSYEKSHHTPDPGRLTRPQGRGGTPAGYEICILSVSFYLPVRIPCRVRTGVGTVSALSFHVGTIYHREMLLILIYSLDIIHVFVN